MVYSSLSRMGRDERERCLSGMRVCVLLEGGMGSEGSDDE